VISVYIQQKRRISLKRPMLSIDKFHKLSDVSGL